MQGTEQLDPASSEKGKLDQRWSCVACHRRKVRCDRTRPSCATCVKNNVDCEYKTPAAPRRRTKATERNIAEKLLRYEEHLKRIGATVDEKGEIVPPTQQRFTSTLSLTPSAPGAPAGQLPDDRLRSPSDQSSYQINPSPSNTTDAAKSPSTEDGTLLVDRGRSRYLENNLWVTLNEELRNPRHVIDQGLDNQEEDDNTTSSDSGAFAIIMNPGLAQNPIEYYPNPEHTMLLWQAYLSNANPLLKMVHAPTFAKLVEQSCKNPRALSRIDMAALFAVHYTAIVTLTNDECQRDFGQSRSLLLKRYRAASENAFRRAGLLRTSDFTLLTAFITYVIASRSTLDAQTVWTLAGVALRIGQRLGLHRDGASLRLTHFETEMRRRVWKQVLILEWSTSELAGVTPVHPFLIHFDMTLPRNLNDEDFDPSMTEMPEERTGATEMLFCLLRYEFGSFFRVTGPERGPTFDASWTNLNSLRTLAEKDRFLDELETRLEQKFLRYCDPIYPLHLLTSTVARSALCGMRLRAHHPRQYPDAGASLPQEEQDKLFQWSLKVIKYDTMSFTNPVLRPFQWHMRCFFQHQALIYLLTEARSRRVGSDIDQAWEGLEDVYKHHPELLERKHILHTAIGMLSVQAWDAREAELVRLGRPVRVPSFIARLRKQPWSQSRPKDMGTTPSSSEPQATSGGQQARDAGFAAAGSQNLNLWDNSTPRQQQAPIAMDTVMGLNPGWGTDWSQWDPLLLNFDMPFAEIQMSNFDTYQMPTQS